MSSHRAPVAELDDLTALDLSDATIQRLQCDGYRVVLDLLECSELDLLCVRHFGPARVSSITTALLNAGYTPSWAS